MRTAPAARETLATATIALIGAIDLRLRARDERRQTIDAAIVGHRRLRLRLRLILRLRAVLARLLLVAVIGLLVVALMMIALVAHIGLRLVLLWHETRLLAEA
jgi:hypothetical protein